MKKLIILLVFAAPAYAEDVCGFKGLKSFAKETITVSSTAKAFTTATYAPADGFGRARAAFVTVAADNVRFWLDGSTPTATVGHLALTNGTLYICDLDISNTLFIRQTTDVTLSVTYLRGQ